MLRTKNVELYPADFLDISPPDAAELRILNGAKVRLRSTHGEAVLAVRVNDAVKPGELFTTFHTTEVFLNNVTSAYRDKQTLAPEYKVTAVRIEKL